MAVKQDALKRAQTSSPDYKREAGKAIPATYKNILEAPIGTLMQQTTTGKLWTLTQKDKDYIKNMLNGEKTRPAAEQQRGEALKDAQNYSVPPEPQTPQAPQAPVTSAPDMPGLEARVTALEQQMAELLSQRPTAPAVSVAPTPIPVASTPAAPVTQTPVAQSHPDLWQIPESLASITPMLQNNW